MTVLYIEDILTQGYLNSRAILFSEISDYFFWWLNDYL